ncbi:MAG: T9SS type A sorting domain-containing protein [Ignavibacteria bacterium]
MKLYIVSILMIWSLDSYCQQYWLSVGSPVNHSINRSHFIDTVNGWAAGDSGIIIHTSNSGQSWVQQSTGISTFAIDDIFFINQRLGWALANDFFFAGSVVLRTSNGGANWTSSRYPDSTLVFNAIYFLDSLTGFMSGYSGLIYKTTNAGNTWTNCYIDTSYCSYLYLFPKNRFYFINSQTGFVCGGQIDIQGIIWRTTNGGDHWYTYCVASEPLYDIKATTPNKIISNGGDFEYGLSTVISTDGGNSWNYELNNIIGKGSSIAYRTPREVWVPLSFSQTFAVNIDSGNIGTAWREIQTPDNRIINSTVFMTPTFGWSFGSGGSIYRYNTSVIGLSENGSENLPAEFEIHQNFPNPFNPSTTISYTLVNSGMVKIDIFDIGGKLIKELFNGYQPSGYHDINWNANDASSGIYFCRVSGGPVNKTIKMLLVK